MDATATDKLIAWGAASRRAASQGGTGMDAGRTGAFVARLRRERGLTQQQLAEQLLVSDKAVSKWETGRGLPDIDNLEGLARTLDTNVAELLRGERIAEPLGAADADVLVTDSLALVRRLLQQRTLGNILLGFLAGLVIVTLVAVHLTSPYAMTYEDGLIRVDELADGQLIARAREDAAGITVKRGADPDAPSRTWLFVSCYRTLWDRLCGARGESIALLGRAGQIDRVYYYPGAGGDELLFPDDSFPDGGVMTLPRLVYNYWIVLGAALSAVGLAAYLLLRKKRFAERILKAALLPICLTASTLAVLAGNYGRIYDAAFYLSGILLVAIALYALLLVVCGRVRAARHQQA